MPFDRSRFRAALIALALASILAVGIALRTPAAAIGYTFDDYGHLAARHDAFPVHRAAWDLYAYVFDRPNEHEALRAAGNLPWWSHPHVQFAMFRPLASLLIALDDRVAPIDARTAHLHSFAWWCAAVLALAWCVSRRNGVAVTLVATALFALAESNSLGVAWIANRTALISAAFGLLALGFHQRARDQGGRRDVALAACCYALALAGGEYAIGLYAYAIAIEVARAGLPAGTAAPPDPLSGDGQRESGGAGARARRIAAIAVPLLVYVVVYVARGYGTRGSEAYVDPFREPARFLALAPGRIGSLWLMAYGGFALDRVLALNVPGGVLFAIGLLSAAVVVALAWYASTQFVVPSRRTVRGLAIASPFAMLPMSAGFPSPRLAIDTSVGASIAMAAVIVAAVRAWVPRSGNDPSRRATPRARGTIVAAVALTCQHGYFVPARAHADLVEARTLGNAGRACILASPARLAMRDDTRALVLAAADPSTLFYAPTMWHLESRGEIPMPRSWWVVSMVMGAQLLFRSGNDTLEIRALQADMLVGPFERLFRDAGLAMHEGDRFVAGELTVTLRAMGARGPRWLTLRREGGWDAPEIVMLLPTTTGIVRVPMPRVGAGIPVPPGAIPNCIPAEAVPRS
jgi:hypothetical protein